MPNKKKGGYRSKNTTYISSSLSSSKLSLSDSKLSKIKPSFKMEQIYQSRICNNMYLKNLPPTIVINSQKKKKYEKMFKKLNQHNNGIIADKSILLIPIKTGGGITIKDSILTHMNDYCENIKSVISLDHTINEFKSEDNFMKAFINKDTTLSQSEFDKIINEELMQFFLENNKNIECILDININSLLNYDMNTFLPRTSDLNVSLDFSSKSYNEDIVKAFEYEFIENDTIRRDFIKKQNDHINDLNRKDKIIINDYSKESSFKLYTAYINKGSNKNWLEDYKKENGDNAFNFGDSFYCQIWEKLNDIFVKKTDEKYAMNEPTPTLLRRQSSRNVFDKKEDIPNPMKRQSSRRALDINRGDIPNPLERQSSRGALDIKREDISSQLERQSSRGALEIKREDIAASSSLQRQSSRGALDIKRDEIAAASSSHIVKDKIYTFDLIYWKYNSKRIKDDEKSIFEDLNQEQWEIVLDEFIKNVNNIVLNAPKLEYDLFCYRGVKNHYIRGTKDIYFISTRLSSFSLNFEKSYGYYNKLEGDQKCMYKTIISAGVNVLFIPKISFASDELEIITPINTIIIYEKDEQNNEIPMKRNNNNRNNKFGICSPIEEAFNSTNVIIDTTPEIELYQF